MDAARRRELSRLVSHALRHEPLSYGLHPDGAGWVPVADLLGAVRAAGGQFSAVDFDDLVEMIAKSDKQRHQIQGPLIRALYGHSLPGQVLRPVAEPPEVLFHGTSAAAWAEIQRDGLQPMGRQFVHLSVERQTAQQVGARKGAEVVLIGVQARAASRDGVVFRVGNDRVWLADPIKPEYLSLSAISPEEGLLIRRRLERSP